MKSVTSSQQIIIETLVKKVSLPSRKASVALYNFSNTTVSRTNREEYPLNTLFENYGKQLLIPLFQESSLYKRMNTINNTSPRFTMDSAYQEVSEYLGIGKRLRDKLFLLLDSDQKPIFSDLVGYAIGFGIERSSLESFFQKTFVPGSLGTDTAVCFDMEITIPELSSVSEKYMYFNGIGINEAYQGNGLGLFLTYEFLKESKKKNYRYGIARVVKGANNWDIFAGNPEKNQKQIPGITWIATYTKESEAFPYRAIFLIDIPQTIQKLEALLQEKYNNIYV